jgi:glycosyltransferase involved in cell wall biosynthesis
MKILYLKKHMHDKNNNALMNYRNISYYIIENENLLDTIDLNQFDCVYSPAIPINVSRYPNIKFLFGPHFSVFPEKHQMDIIRGKNVIYIQPSEWAKNVWLFHPFCRNIRLEVLPFGVDTIKFSPCKSISERNNVFIYYKRRNPHELQILFSFLQQNNLNPRIFNYVTKYPEQEYINYLKESKFGIWFTAHESQGFALQEALSCDVPLLVWNVISMNQEYESHFQDIKATTIPYWDERCGESFAEFKELPSTFQKFISKLNDYKPREYILENLSMEQCEQKFIEVINKI